VVRFLGLGLEVREELIFAYLIPSIAICEGNYPKVYVRKTQSVARLVRGQWL